MTARVLRVVALLLLVLLLPGAQAAEALVTLSEEEGAWNGLSRVDLDAADGDTVRVWVPAAARVRDVQAHPEDAGRPAWRAAGPDALAVEVPPNATRVDVRWDVPGAAGFEVRAPQAYERLTVHVMPPEGLVPDDAGAAFEPASPAGYRAVVAPAPEGHLVAVRLVAPDRVGELPVLASVAAIATLVLALTYAWHRVRPPLEGREPARFLDHLSEMQARLLPPAVVFVALNAVFFTTGLRQHGRLVLPVFGVDASLASRAFDAFAERLVPAGVQLVVLRPADAVLAQIEMALFLAFASVVPLLAYELASFLGPALMARERRMLLALLPVVGGLFLVGALVGFLVLAPIIIETLYDYAPTVGAAPLLGVLDLVSFAVLIVAAMGIAFELPVVMYALARLGIVRAATFRRYLRHAALVIVLVAGVLTPDPSVVSQLILAVPVLGLYTLGVAVAYMAERARPSA